MREGNRRRPTRGWGFAAAGLLGALCLATPAGAVPPNDNYLNSLQLNPSGKPLNRVDTLVDRPNTTGATVQTDIFNPPQPGNPLMSGGPPEPTTCQGVNYGATIWYDFHPDINGLVRIRTSGLNTAISLLQFSALTALPDFAHRRCVLNLSTMSGELIAAVAAGRAYTVQIGGVGGAQGPLEFLFDFVPQIARISADATLAALTLAPGGVQIRSLNVTAPRGTRVEVRCSRGCRPQARSAKTLSFPGLKGTRLAARAKLKIFVTAPNAIGAYIEYRIRRRSFSKIVRCLKPGSRKPRLTC